MKKEKIVNSNEYIPTKKGLERLYDVINRIAKNYTPDVIDTSKWFITEEELKKNPENKFIKK